MNTYGAKVKGYGAYGERLWGADSCKVKAYGERKVNVYGEQGEWIWGITIQPKTLLRKILNLGIYSTLSHTNPITTKLLYWLAIGFFRKFSSNTHKLKKRIKNNTQQYI